MPLGHEIETRRRLCAAVTLGYLHRMRGFLSAMFEEMGARRKRLREAFGDRGQGIAEFLVLAGLFVGSLGLFVRDWMPAAAPWGFAAPLLFLVGYLVIEARRQQAIAVYVNDPAPIDARLDAQEWERRAQAIRSEEDSDEKHLREAKSAFDADAERRRRLRRDNPSSVSSPVYDRAVFLWTFGCALLGAAAFAVAWSAQPANSSQHEDWRPPSNAVQTEIAP